MVSVRTLSAHLGALPIRRAEARTASRAGTGRRNVAIDVLRGYCIVMMVTSHVAVDSQVNLAVHALRFVSGAEGFVFLSGLVLGMVYHRRMTTGPIRDAYRAIWRRARTIWAVHVVTVLAAVSLNTVFGIYSDIPTFRQASLGRILWHTAILRLQPGHMLNILPMYVFLLALAPAALELMRRRQTGWLLLGCALTFLNTQYHPGAGRWADALSQGDAFPVTAWQVLFFPGMVIGYHYTTLRERIVGPHRMRLLWSLAAATAITAVVVSVQTPHFEFYDHVAWDLFLWNRQPLRFGRVLYFLLSVGGAYLVAQAWLRSSWLPRAPMTVLETLGRNSLYAFLVHLFIAMCLDLIRVPVGSVLLPDAMAISAVAAVYAMARYQVGRRWIPN